ncbi:unnamed protein product [Amoebophrya sp. A25]|nr:unnamed protein product [Amoebophrya sp. A25]|eukprot:GSA25T00005129001.1
MFSPMSEAITLIDVLELKHNLICCDDGAFSNLAVLVLKNGLPGNAASGEHPIQKLLVASALRLEKRNGTGGWLFLRVCLELLLLVRCDRGRDFGSLQRVSRDCGTPVSDEAAQGHGWPDCIHAEAKSSKWEREAHRQILSERVLSSTASTLASTPDAGAAVEFSGSPERVQIASCGRGNLAAAEPPVSSDTTGAGLLTHTQKWFTPERSATSNGSVVDVAKKKWKQGAVRGYGTSQPRGYRRLQIFCMLLEEAQSRCRDLLLGPTALACVQEVSMLDDFAELRDAVRGQLEEMRMGMFFSEILGPKPDASSEIARAVVEAWKAVLGDCDDAGSLPVAMAERVSVRLISQQVLDHIADEDDRYTPKLACSFPMATDKSIALLRGGILVEHFNSSVSDHETKLGLVLLFDSLDSVGGSRDALWKLRARDLVASLADLLEVSKGEDRRCAGRSRNLGETASCSIVLLCVQKTIDLGLKRELDTLSQSPLCRRKLVILDCLGERRADAIARVARCRKQTLAGSLSGQGGKDHEETMATQSREGVAPLGGCAASVILSEVSGDGLTFLTPKVMHSSKTGRVWQLTDFCGYAGSRFFEADEKAWLWLTPPLHASTTEGAEKEALGQTFAPLYTLFLCPRNVLGSSKHAEIGVGQLLSLLARETVHDLQHIISIGDFLERIVMLCQDSSQEDEMDGENRVQCASIREAKQTLAETLEFCIKYESARFFHATTAALMEAFDMVSAMLSIAARKSASRVRELALFGQRIKI